MRHSDTDHAPYIDAPPEDPAATTQHRVVIVGGGAGGLELATSLGNRFGRGKHSSGRMHITLIDRHSVHIWKPLLHEVAAGSMDAHTHQLEYAAQARWHRFVFQQGELTGLDRARKIITVSALHDEHRQELIPQRDIPYDTLVLAIGSVTNFFGVPGAAQHATALDSLNQAEHFRRRMISLCMRADRSINAATAHHSPASVNIAIIGAGATGVELAAELRNTAEVLGAYGLHHLDPHRDIHISIIEAAPRVLSALPEPVSQKTTVLLRQRNIDVRTNSTVAEVQENSVILEQGEVIPADLTVWAAGIRAPQVLERLGLPINRLGQVLVLPTLQTEADPDIFAFGDCAACPWPEKNSTVPPRAQAAHQQATFLVDAFKRRLAGLSPQPYIYRDLGSLVSLGRFDGAINQQYSFHRRFLRAHALHLPISHASHRIARLVAHHCGLYRPMVTAQNFATSQVALKMTNDCTKVKNFPL